MTTIDTKAEAKQLGEDLLTKIDFNAEANPSGKARSFLERIDLLYNEEGFICREDVAAIHGLDAATIPTMDPAAYETFYEIQDDRVSRILRGLLKIASSYDLNTLKTAVSYYETNFLCSRCAN